MIAKKCDRCGAFYEPYNVERNKKETNGIIRVNIDEVGQYYSHEPIDLCISCKDSFEKWLKEAKDNKKKEGE